MPTHAPAMPEDALSGLRVRLVGRFASVSRRETAAAVKRRGGALDDSEPDLIVVGEDATDAEREEADSAARELSAECVSESELWRRLGLVEDDQGVRRLYSPAMLGELVGAPLAAVRRWARRGALRPARWVNRLAYFDFEEARVAQLLAELLRQRRSLASVDSLIDRLAEAFPECDRPLAELPLAVEDGSLLLRSSDSLREATGQRRLDFDSMDAESELEGPQVLRLPETPLTAPTGLRERAWALSDEGRLGDAIEAWRLAMLESPPTAEDHFVLAEWLYSAGQAAAARERYYAALELDPEHLEARVNLGCVLCDLGEYELAAAAVRGALDQHESFADAHFHLARIHQRQGDAVAAEPHWRRFLEIAPESPWAEEARGCLGMPPAAPSP